MNGYHHNEDNSTQNNATDDIEDDQNQNENPPININNIQNNDNNNNIQDYDYNNNNNNSNIQDNDYNNNNNINVEENGNGQHFSEAVTKLLDVLNNKCNEWERRREADFGEEKLGAMMYGFICGYIISKNQAQTFSFQQPPDPLRLMERSFDGLGSGFDDPSHLPYDDMMNYMNYYQNTHDHQKHPHRTHSDHKKRAAHELHDNFSNGGTHPDRMFSFPNQLSQQNDLYSDVPYMPEPKRPRSSRSSAGPSYGSTSSREDKIKAYKRALGVEREGVLELFQKQPWCERQKPMTVYRQWDTLQTYLLREPNWYKQWREFAVVSKAAVLSRVSNNSDRLEYVLNTKPEKSSMYQILTRSDQEFNRKFPLFREWVKERKQMGNPTPSAQNQRFFNHPQHQLSLPL